jgi:integrase/recombinase XerC
MTATSRTPPPVRARTDAERPAWFRAFLTDRATRKPSPHTLQAYRQDFDAIARIVADDPQQISALTPRSITKDSMRQPFAAYAESHEAASIRRGWSTWNTLCCYLFTADLVPANPMELVGRPKLAKALPKSLPQPAAQALLNAIDVFPCPAAAVLLSG